MCRRGEETRGVERRGEGRRAEESSYIELHTFIICLKSYILQVRNIPFYIFQYSKIIYYIKSRGKRETERRGEGGDSGGWQRVTYFDLLYSEIVHVVLHPIFPILYHILKEMNRERERERDRESEREREWEGERNKTNSEDFSWLSPIGLFIVYSLLLQENMQERNLEYYLPNYLTAVFPTVHLDSDIVDVPMKTPRIRYLLPFCSVCSIIMHIVDMVFDYNIAIRYLLSDKIAYFIWTICIIIIPSLTNCIISGRMQTQDKKVLHTYL